MCATTRNAKASPINVSSTSSRANTATRHRPQPQYQPPPPQNQPQPVLADAGGVDRLPSFITGPQPQVNGTPGGYEGNGSERGERFPRRRRRPHGPRPDNVAAPAGAERRLQSGERVSSGNTRYRRPGETQGPIPAAFIEARRSTIF